MKYLLLILFFIVTMLSTMHAQKKLDPIPSTVRAVTMRLKPGEDLKMKLDEYVVKNKISAAFIFTCVGSLEKVAIRYANQPNTDILSGKFEIVSLTGTVAASGSHLHISVSDSTGKTIGGHLKEGSLIYTTAEIVIGILPGVVYGREVDSTYGYKELSVKKDE